MGWEEHLPGGFLLTTTEKVAGYARARSVWPASFGLACCAMEAVAVGGPRHDAARFGMEKVGTPQADLMIVDVLGANRERQVTELEEARASRIRLNGRQPKAIPSCQQ